MESLSRSLSLSLSLSLDVPSLGRAAPCTPSAAQRKLTLSPSLPTEQGDIIHEGSMGKHHLQLSRLEIFNLWGKGFVGWVLAIRLRLCFCLSS